jgi:regulator of replication initiation timing
MSVKMTPELFQKIIEEETKKMFDGSKSTEDFADSVEEVDADELATNLANKIDYVKALKLEESRLNTRLAKIRQTKQSMKKQFGI